MSETIAQRSRLARWRRRPARPIQLGRAAAATEFPTSISLLLALPLMILLLVIYIAPIAALVPASVGAPRLDFSKYTDIATDPFYQAVFIRTFRLAGEVMLLVIVIAYPTAYLIWRSPPNVAALLLILVLFPLYTSVLVRNYAWTALLARNGVINDLLQALGLVSEPLRILNTETAVLIGMVHVLTPYAILPMYTALRRIDPVYLQASSILGASGWETFRRVVFPLSLPGTIAAAVLVFVLALGFYITPAILGGPKSLMAANLIDTQVNKLLDFGSGAAMAIVLLVFAVGLMGAAYRFFDIDRLLREGAE